MNNEQAQQDWNNLKSKLKARWDKLQDTDLEKFRGNMHLVPRRVESIYKISRSQAMQEYADFMKALQNPV